MTADATSGDAGAKWALGALGAVVAALLIWLLARDGGLLNPKAPTSPPKAIVSVLAFDTAMYPRQGSNVGFTIWNDGDAVASRCRIQGNTLHAGEFDVPAHSSVKVVESLHARALGFQTLSYDVVCANSTSAPVTKAVKVVSKVTR